MSAKEEEKRKKEKEAEAKGQTNYYKGYGKPIRICLKLGKHTPLDAPFTYDIDRNASKGIALTMSAFLDYCKRTE